MPAPEMTPKQQWSEQIKAAKSILLLPHANPDGDAIGSALALKLALEKIGKEVTLVVSGILPESFSFLPNFDEVKRDLAIRKDLLLVIDETQARIGNVSLKRISETKLMVVVTPKEGVLTPANVRIEEGSFNTDLVIALDCASAERLGSIYEENPNLFYEIPVINVDHHPGNTNFGKINIVDVAASSTAEILVSLLETLGKDSPTILDAEIATCLLTGVTSDTGSFQNSNTTPKSLTVAAQLVAAGGRQQEIIKQLFKTKSLSTLRLWGRALSYIKEDSSLHFIWSILTKADFVAAQADLEESSGVIDELLKTASGTDFVLLLSERDGAIHGSLRSVIPTVDVSLIAGLFGGGGHTQAAAFHLEDAQLAQQELNIINKIRDYLRGKETPRQEELEEIREELREELIESVQAEALPAPTSTPPTKDVSRGNGSKPSSPSIPKSNKTT